MNVRMLSIAGTVAGMLAAGGIAVAQTSPAVPAAPAVVAQAQPPMRGERGSDRNLRQVRRRLEGIIDSLQRDQHDYNGHRVAAIRDLEQARQELDAALQADQNR